MRLIKANSESEWLFLTLYCGFKPVDPLTVMVHEAARKAQDRLTNKEQS